MYLHLVGPARAFRAPDCPDCGQRIYVIESYDRAGYIEYRPSEYESEEDILYEFRQNGLKQLIQAAAWYYLRQARQAKRAKTK